MVRVEAFFVRVAVVVDDGSCDLVGVDVFCFAVTFRLGVVVPSGAVVLTEPVTRRGGILGTSSDHACQSRLLALMQNFCFLGLGPRGRFSHSGQLVILLDSPSPATPLFW